MKSIQHVTSNAHVSRKSPSAWGLISAVVLGALGTAAFTTVRAQATSSHIFGQAPAGETITVHSDAGIHRHGEVDAKGHYSITSLPPGVYTVTLEKEGKTVNTQPNIPLNAGRGVEVDFACPNDQCASSGG
jgi:hypothetical protein